MGSNDVPVHELKAGLSRYLARAKAGEVIVVTSHNKPVARLVGVSHTGTPGIDRLIDSGAAHWNGRRPAFVPPVELAAGGRSLAQAVLEDRG